MENNNIGNTDYLIKNIKNYSDVCNELGILEFTEDNIESLFTNEQCSKIIALHQILNIQKLFNGNWKVNLEDLNQRKYYPYYIIKAGLGLVFGASYCHFGFFFGVVALYKDQKTSDFIGKTFIDIYKKLL